MKKKSEDKMKRILNHLGRAVLISALVLSIGNPALAAEKASIQLNQNNVLNVSPVIRSGSALVPLRAVGSLLGAEVQWESASKTITVAQADKINTLQVNSKIAYKEAGGQRESISLATAPTVIDSATYVPLRYLAESLDIHVLWDQATRTVNIDESFDYKGYKLFFGENKEKVLGLLGQADYSLKDEYYEYLFYTSDYENVLILYFEGGKLAGFTSNAVSVKYRDYSYDAKNTTLVAGLSLIQDEHRGKKTVGLGYNIYRKPIASQESLYVNEKMIFELTNGFRAHHGVGALTFSEALSDVARAHTDDMAANNYFDHTNLKGLGPSDRITQAGISWVSCGENIAAGNSTALKTMEQWVNSLGHRENMLQQRGELGVGGTIKANSEYKYYYGQNFALQR